MKLIYGIECFFFGSALCSFMMCMTYRIRKKESILVKRSHCDNCYRILKWSELIPILGWIIVGGKCPQCKRKIPILYPMLEALMGFLTFYVFFIK